MKVWPILLALALSGAARGHERYTIINPEASRSVERMCSRPSPGPIQRYWLPRPPVVESAERLLPLYVALTERPAKPVSEYYRQYVGIVVADRQLIYVNLFHESSLETWDFVREHLPGKALPPGDDWRREVVNVCDGGDDYWSVLFDPELKVFFSQHFNGVVRVPPDTALQLTAAREANRGVGAWNRGECFGAAGGSLATANRAVTTWGHREMLWRCREAAAAAERPIR